MKHIILIITTFIMVFLMCNKKEYELDPRIYGTWKCIWCSIPSNDIKDTISITFSNDSLKDSICHFITFNNNKSYEYFEINGTSNNKIVYQKGNIRTEEDVFCLSYACYYSTSFSNDTLVLSHDGDPGYPEHYRKFTICWSNN
jgi:hypothetical protein